MPINIVFDYVSVHSIAKNAGNITYNPALPNNASRLYVIRNTQANNFPYYIGTASNVANRFAPRATVVRELGFRNHEINNISIAIVQIIVNGFFQPPHDNGIIAAGVDVEHLLIRSHMVQGQGVRNISKLAVFPNNSGQRINCNFLAIPAWLHFLPGNHFINNGNIY